jgi:hypothetical protein
MRFTGSQSGWLLVSLRGNAQTKAPYKEAAESSTAPEAIAKTIKRRRRRRKLVTEPVAVPEPTPKTLMQRILEEQRAQLNELSETIRKAIG